MSSLRYLFPLLTGVLLAGAVSAQEPAPADQEVDVSTHYLQCLFLPKGGLLQECRLLANGHDIASESGLLLEGFGIGSPYVPNRRTNEKFGILEQIQDHPVLQYSYDCDGPNINGLSVTRIMEPMLDEASIRVRWTVRNKGKGDVYAAPWVRSEAVPGGKMDPQDRLDVPTLQGIRRIERPSYHPAARNWIAATDPTAKESVYAVFNADQLHSFFAQPDQQNADGMQAAFVPKLLKPGDIWETTYRVNIVRGLTRVDFGSQELAAQLDYAPGKLDVRFVTVKPLPTLRIDASIRDKNGKVFPLPARQFTATPDKVVVASYEWTAPVDGAYEFLAQLLQDGKSYPLNKEMGTPHNGIDTQFVAGKPKTVTLEAWTDAPYALDRGPRKAKRDLAVAGDIPIWFENALDKVSRQDIPDPSGKIQPRVQLGLARNEHESFQVVMRPPEGKRLSNVSVRVGDLAGPRGAKIPASNVSIYNVRYYNVRVPSHFEGPTGDWPDALMPFQPFSVDGGQTAPVWFTVYAPAGIPAGTYSGSLTLQSDETGTVQLGIDAKVYDFDLPATPALKTDFGFYRDAAVQWGRYLGYKGSDDDLVSAYVTNALDHRVTLREGAQLPAESADYAASLKAYAPRLKQLMDRGATTFAVPPSLLETPEQLKLANDFVAKNNLQGRAFCPIADEPPRPAWPRLSERMQQWNSLAPNIPLMVTTSGLEPYLPEMGGIWGVHLQMLDTLNNEPILARLKEGKEVWPFVNAFPPRPYGNFFIDFQPIEHRLLFWQVWALGMSGFHYWSVNYIEPNENPYQNQLDATPTNGDGLLVYPGEAGPVNSIRWENIRDGIEDFDYLMLLRQRADASKDAALKQKAQQAANLQALVPNLVGFTRDPRAVEAKRAEIADLIAQLR
jgi:hypothetical protein